MAWTFDLPSCLKLDTQFSDYYPSNLEVAYDGKNLWYVNKDRTALVVVDFWGPYDDTNNGFYVRHLAQEDDEIRIGGRGPDINIRGLVKPKSKSRIQSITYMNGCIYVLHERDEFMYKCDITRVYTDLRRTGVITASAPRTVSSSGSVPVIEPDVWCCVPHLFTSESMNTDIVGVNGRLFFVDAPPNSQNPLDAQDLCHFAVSSVPPPAPVVPDEEPPEPPTISVSRTAIPGRKQKAKRNLAVANDCVYVTAFNELNIYKFGSDGSSISTIQVNRDVQNIFTVDTELWVISTNKSELTFGSGDDAKDVPSYMVSKINSSDTMTHVVGFPSSGGSLANMHFGHDGAHIWVMGLDGKFSKIKLSNLTAIVSDTAIAEGDDFNFRASHLCYTGALTGSSYLSSADTSSNLINLWVSPPQSYEWYNGESFVTVNVPRHLFIFRDGDFILMQRLPGALKYQSSFKTNQYVALSSGPRRYKAD